MAVEERNSETVEIARQEARKRYVQKPIRTDETVSREKNVYAMGKKGVMSGDENKRLRTSKPENEPLMIGKDGKKIKVKKREKERIVKVGNRKDIFTRPKHKEKEVLPKIKKERKSVSGKETEKRRRLMKTRKRGLMKEYSSI